MMSPGTDAGEPRYTPTDDLDHTPHWRRRVLRAALLLLAILLLALTPPLLNVSRLQRRIAASMSESMGRPVHLDRVSLHLLPVPGFTLQNLVVSEDPAFGSEPTIRANVVEATLRPSSLWRRQVEFSSIRFIEPSLNLVRNNEGRWNLQSLLMHAARVDTAPTAQPKAGPAPRFPYIEATGARVNLKLANEKMPFSLTEADFALWLPSPQQWRVRLEAKPARTDTNVSDPGTVRLEGALERAATLSAVPVDLHLSWRDAPLGEASRLLSGNDAGWRGTLHLDASVTGLLGAAQVQTHLTLNDLRRADYVPAHSLDLSVRCHAVLETPKAVMHDPACALDSPKVTASAQTIDLTSLGASGIQFETAGVPEAWVLDWARLFTQKIPANLNGVGTVAGAMAFLPAHDTVTAGWKGELKGDVSNFLPGVSSEPGIDRAPLLIVGGPDGLILAPLNLMPPGKTPPLTLTGSATGNGYTLRLSGAATRDQLQSLRDLMPPLTEGLDQAVPALAESPKPEDAPANPTTPPQPLSLDVTCSRTWNAPQLCVAAATAAKPPTTHPVRKRR